MKQTVLWILALVVVGYFSFKLGQSSVHCDQSASASNVPGGACGVPVIDTPPPPPSPNSSHM